MENQIIPSEIVLFFKCKSKANILIDAVQDFNETELVYLHTTLRYVVIINLTEDTLGQILDPDPSLGYEGKFVLSLVGYVGNDNHYENKVLAILMMYHTGDDELLVKCWNHFSAPFPQRYFEGLSDYLKVVFGEKYIDLRQGKDSQGFPAPPKAENTIPYYQDHPWELVNDPKYKKLIKLAHHGTPYKEIGLELGYEYGTVRKKISEFRRKHPDILLYRRTPKKAK